MAMLQLQELKTKGLQQQQQQKTRTLSETPKVQQKEE